MVKNLSDEEVLKFYSESQHYIYEVLQPYLNPEVYRKDINYLRILAFAKKILEKESHCRVLDFGGSPGELSLLFISYRMRDLLFRLAWCDIELCFMEV